MALLRQILRLAVVLAGLLPMLAPGAAADFNEYHLKAAFLYNFAKFVDWPPAAGEPEGAFRVCILGDDAFESVRETLAGKTIKGKAVDVARVERVDAARACQLLFVTAPDSARAERGLSILGNQVLTVGETDEFVKSGGLINLKTVDNRIRFEIARLAGEQAGFRFRVQLLQRAILVDQPK
ncbi:MAG TPA: YfiR family protein [Rhodocyclaceae bacterium]|nr:YfiR family protein [Rhodocyclaceae bacterium]